MATHPSVAPKRQPRLSASPAGPTPPSASPKNAPPAPPNAVVAAGKAAKRGKQAAAASASPTASQTPGASVVGARWSSRIIGEADVAPIRLIPNPQNWRKHLKPQRDAMNEVLDRIGWIQRVIVNKRTGHIVDGHLRAEQALEAKEKTIPVCYVDLSEEEELAALATFDPLSAMARADQKMLEGIIAQIGQSDADLAAMLQRIAEDGNALPFTQSQTDLWVGMPEFDARDTTAFKSVTLHFETEEDLAEYCELTHSRITPDTRMVFFPFKNRKAQEDAYVAS